jgi:glycosyltransferase involved in cell wall biosynthesis
MTSNIIKVAIPQIGSSAWTGGVTYQNNLMYALNQFAHDIEVVEISSDAGSPVSNWKSKVIALLTKLHRLMPRGLADFFYGHYKHATSGMRPSESNIDVVFSLGYYDKNVQVATLSWIPDFQHVHLPEMFTEQEIYARDNGYRHIANSSTLVVLSSNNALKDFSGFVPAHAHKGRVMRFVANVPEIIYSEDSSTVYKQYDLPEKFIYLPNQFWKHKNHSLVLDALHILKSRNIKPFVVFTGNTKDHRNPTFFDDLMQKISSLDLRDQIAVLGLIPHEDVYKLLRQSLFVLNPSLFEGWSTTVEETKSIGKRILLSDIEVHKEQAPPNSVFFNPRDPEDLALCLKELWDASMPGPDIAMEQQAREQLPKRIKQFADTFTGIAKEAVSLTKKRTYL